MVNSNAEQYRHANRIQYVASCRDALAEEKGLGRRRADGNNISVLNWNIQKERQKIWSEEFQSQAAEKDLVLMQEASLRFDTINGIDSSKHWSFAPGYTLDGEITGVMTLSRKPAADSMQFCDTRAVAAHAEGDQCDRIRFEWHRADAGCRQCSRGKFFLGHRCIQRTV